VRRYFIECERIAREAMAGAGLDPKVVGGIMKSVVNKALDEAIRARLPEMVAAAITADGRRAALAVVSVRQILDEAKALPKGRNSLNRRIGRALLKLAAGGRLEVVIGRVHEFFELKAVRERARAGGRGLARCGSGLLQA
jgi:hypothetical protein